MSGREIPTNNLMSYVYKTDTTSWPVPHTYLTMVAGFESNRAACEWAVAKNAEQGDPDAGDTYFVLGL